MRALSTPGLIRLLVSTDGVMALFLFNPFTVASCVAGTLSSFENLCVLAAVWCGIRRDAAGAAFAVAAGAYLGLHPFLLLVRASTEACGVMFHRFWFVRANPVTEVVLRHQLQRYVHHTTPHTSAHPSRTPQLPIGLLVAVGPEDVLSGSTPPSGKQSDTQQSDSQAEAAKQQQQQDPGTLGTAAKLRGAVDKAVSTQRATVKESASTAAKLLSLFGFKVLVLFWLACLVAVSDILVRGHRVGGPCLPQLARWALGPVAHSSGSNAHTSAATATAASFGAGAQKGGMGTAITGSHTSGGEQGACWAVEVYRLHLLVADQTPNIGQLWYFFTEMFRNYLPFFRCVTVGACEQIAL